VNARAYGQLPFLDFLLALLARLSQKMLFVMLQYVHS
jgi:hypothetical protein